MAESKAVINAEKLRVYPCSTRSDKNDLNAKLNSEQNIVSVVNRLTKTTSGFVVGKLRIKSFGGVDKDLTFYPFEVNIFGYLFKILDKVTFTYSQWKDKTKIVAYIKTETIESAGTSFEQLKPNIEFNGTINDYTGDEFKPLTIAAVDDDTYAEILTTSGIKSLLLAEKVSGTEYWHTATFNNIPFRAQDIGISISDSDIEDYDIITSRYSAPQTLYDWIVSNYIIDDGDLDA